MAPPLSTHRRQALADWFEFLANEYRRQDANQTQKAIGTAADPTPYPTKTSTVPKQRFNQVDQTGQPVQPNSPTESAALNPDQTITDAAQLLADQETLLTLTKSVGERLRAWRPDRAGDHCSRCGGQLQNGSTRCHRIINGRRCEASPISSNIRQCRICTQVVEPGAPLPAGRCTDCHTHFVQKGYERIIGLSADALIADGRALAETTE